MASNQNIGRSPSNGERPPAYDVAASNNHTPAKPNCEQLQTVVTVQAPPIFAPLVQSMQHPSYDGPADFLVLVVVIAVLCAALNPTTWLLLGPLQLAMAVVARNKKDSYDYRNAQRYTAVALALAFFNIIWSTAVTSGMVAMAVYLNYHMMPT